VSVAGLARAGTQAERRASRHAWNRQISSCGPSCRRASHARLVSRPGCADSTRSSECACLDVMEQRLNDRGVFFTGPVGNHCHREAPERRERANAEAASGLARPRGRISPKSTRLLRPACGGARNDRGLGRDCFAPPAAGLLATERAGTSPAPTPNSAAGCCFCGARLRACSSWSLQARESTRSTKTETTDGRPRSRHGFS